MWMMRVFKKRNSNFIRESFYPTLEEAWAATDEWVKKGGHFCMVFEMSDSKADWCRFFGSAAREFTEDR